MRSLAGLPCQYRYSSSFMASRLSNFLMGKRDFLSRFCSAFIDLLYHDQRSNISLQSQCPGWWACSCCGTMRIMGEGEVNAKGGMRSAFPPYGLRAPHHPIILSLCCSGWAPYPPVRPNALAKGNYFNRKFLQNITGHYQTKVITVEEPPPRRWPLSTLRKFTYTQFKSLAVR